MVLAGCLTEEKGRDADHPWLKLRFACWIHLAAALALSFQLLFLYRAYSGTFPNTEDCGRCSLLENQYKSHSQHENAGGRSLVQQLVHDVDAFPSLIEPAAGSPLANPFFRLFWLSITYLFLATAVVSLWIWLGTRPWRSHSHNVTAVVISYFAVGCAFAALYYSLYIGESGKYNHLLWTFLSYERQHASTNSSVSPPPLADWAVKAIQETIQSNNIEAQLGVLRARAQSHSAFLQERPHIALDPLRASQKEQEVFQCTFQFPEGKSSLPSRLDESPEAWKRNEEATDLFRSSVLDKIASYLSSEGKEYRVLLTGGADSQRYDDNKDLARERAEAVQKWIEQQIPVTGSTGYYSLRRSLQTAQIESSCVEPKPGTSDPTRLDRLWPAGIPGHSQAASDIHSLWRSVGVVIKEARADAATAVTRIDLTDDGSTFDDMLYFSFMAFTTTGFGDIRPVSSAARFSVVVEIIMDVVFVCIFFTSAMSSELGDARDTGGPRDREEGAKVVIGAPKAKVAKGGAG